MAILIAQLTDIHLKRATDPVVGRADLIARAIASEVTADVALVVIVIGGDCAYSGLPEEFVIAQQLIAKIMSTLKEECPGTYVALIVVAGNHDCNFGSSTAGTSGLVPKGIAFTDSIAGLKNYFEFTRTLSLEYESHTEASPFFAWCDLKTPDGTLRLLLVNTSVFSTLHEQPGSLTIPVADLAAKIDPPARYVLTVLHHPWNWFAQPEFMRPLRDRIEELSDGVLTGHEHSPETIDVTRNDKTKSLYISGGVLQDSGNDANSSFIAVRLDLRALTRSTVTFRYTESGFYQRDNSSGLQSFVGNLARLGRPFDLQQKFSAELDDLGFVIHHPQKQFLTLSDVFIYPDLLVVDDATASARTRQLKSNDVAAKLLSEDMALVSGAEKSGKTCLAKSLFRSAYDAGRLPLLLNGADFRTRKPSAVRDAVRRAVGNQYSNLSADQFEQKERQVRVAIVDDFTQMVNCAQTRDAVLLELEKHFSTVIVLANETFCLSPSRGYEASNLHLWQYTHFNILGFGEVLREQFIRRWLDLGAEVGAAENLRDETDRLVKLINGVIKTTLLPCHPLFLMIVLQQAQSGQPTVRGGSYGHLFESVVTQILNRSKFPKISISAKHKYLAALAFELHNRNAATLLESDAKVWHESYWRGIGASVDYDKFINDLAGVSVIQVVEGAVSFRYKYHYCFFVAYYLAENIKLEPIRRIIRQICSQLYHPESGDILLFLSHLSNDEIVFDEMLRTADVLLQKSPDANLSLDVEKLNRLEKTAPTLALPDTPPDANRIKDLEMKDERVAERSSAYSDGSSLSARPSITDETVNEALQLPAAYKTIQILGQYARNHADSTSVEIKERATRSIFSLAKRTMGFYFDILDQGLPEIAEELASGLREREPDIGRDELLRQVGRHVFGFSQLLCFVTTRYVSNSVAHDLIQPVARSIAADLKDLPSYFFDFGISLEKPGYIDLERLRKLKEMCAGNPFAQTLLRLLVMHHMYLFNVNYKIKQAAAAELEFRPTPGLMASDKKKFR